MHQELSIAELPKRKAKRKPRRRDDLMWKAIFEDLSVDFLRFFFPDADKLFDLNRKCEYLDKEFDPFFPHEEDTSGRVRYVDKLIKVYLKDGGAKWISVHIEVQNQKGKEDFSFRMLRYWYLMKDKYNVSITALAILTSNNKQFKPGPYTEEYLGTKLTYQYNTYKLLDQNEAELKANPNPFAVVILVALSAIKNKNANDLDLKAIKHNLHLELTRRKVDAAKHKGIMNFIKYYVNFNNPKMMTTFTKEVELLLGRTTPMGTEEYLLDKFKKEGREEGRHVEALEIAAEMKKDKFPIETISKLTKLSIEEIQAL
ncbi:putative transposase/invertase (TIGR01784 family) [Pedobacter africanus]|uniref:Transposase/invertase (TIGR01784 family) n=1 Tax=Pedobacter africanus TaxID=151894 RepID=A0ACC6L447_9SPHI|nr:hypothetical protein [Pedobacter africanus]MDR6786121.1 putative transposase/invertase (TIGR01784 family) [Pedobacter africanus]